MMNRLKTSHLRGMLCISFIVLFIQFASTQYTSIPDPNFEQALIDLGIDSGPIDGQLLTSSASLVTHLNIRFENISNLSGIHAFQNLTYLNAGSNDLTNLNLTSLLNLDTLKLFNNNLTSLSLSGLSNLEFINIGFNDLTNIDFSTNNNLKSIFCFSNNFNILDLNSNQNLIELNCSNNSLNSLDLSNNPNLEELDISENQFSFIDLSFNTILSSFNCSKNTFTSLGPFTNSFLEYLNCSENQLTSLDVSGLNLSSLTCDSNQLQTLNLTGNSNLSYLWCNENHLSSLDLTGLNNLTDIRCTENLLSSLNLSGKNLLNSLQCQGNQLLSLDLTGLSNLSTLFCEGNLISSLDLTGLANLSNVKCNDNQLSNLNLSGVINLGSIDCQNNQLTTLDLNGLNLGSLNCSSNQLTSLNISGQSNLYTLILDNNQVTSLDLTNLNNLRTLRCSNNLLSSLDIRNENNTLVAYFNATSNPNLYCIYVDDVSYAYSRWFKDPQGVFTKDDSDTDGDGICDLGDDYYPIPDPFFEQALINLGIDDPVPDQQILNSRARLISILQVNSRNISDLTGINAFINLRNLYCQGNQINNLDVSQLTFLERIFCTQNQISLLNISGLINLNVLRCEVNQLNSLDVRGLTNLQELWCNANPNLYCIYFDNLHFSYSKDPQAVFTMNDTDTDGDGICDDGDDDDDNDGVVDGLDIDPLNPQVCQDTDGDSCDDCSQNPTSMASATPWPAYTPDTGNDGPDADMDGICNATDLKTSIPDPNFEQALIGLGIDSDGIINGQMFTADASGVTSLNVNSKSISDLSGLEAFTELIILDCQNNNLTTLELNTNTHLTTLYCNANQLITLDVSNNIALIEIQSNSNQIASLDVSNNTALESLLCGWNLLSTLNISNNINLTNLGCNSNQLTSLDISNNTDLLTLNCGINQLSNLNVSNNIALTYLSCNTNQLTTLDVSNNSALLSIICNGNQLSSLDISNNISLESLRCYDNQLTSLDPSSSPQLTTLLCHFNNLTSINLTGNPNLDWLWFHSNQLTSVDIRNGNSNNITNFNSTSNPDLYCIYVDDPVYSTTNWTNVDPQSTFTDNPTDTDMDGICDAGDNCPNDANPLQEDFDTDGIGDLCDDCIVGMDIVPPSISCTIAIDTFTSNPSCITPLPDYTTIASATDNCDPSPILTQSPAVGTLITGCDVDLIVKIYAADDSGNVDSCEIHVFTSDLLICPSDTVIYVDQDAGGLNTGLSWMDAIQEPQKAAQVAATCPGVTEVWVAEGNYYPSKVNDRAETISLPSDIRWYGGFIGSETMKNQRDPISHPTIFSGDIGASMDNTDNSYHVLTARNVSSGTLIDGFTVQNGYADGMGDDGYGAGLHNDGNASGNSQIQVNDCTFRNNYALEGGAAVYENATSLGSVFGQYTDCTFEYNTTPNLGGAMLINGFTGVADPVIEACAFTHNQALLGGALYILGFEGQANPIIDRCVLGENTATDKGGAIFINAREMGQGNPFIRNSILYRNHADLGGAIYNDGLNGTVGTHSINNTFALNEAITGPSIYNFYASPTTENSVLWSIHPSLEIADVVSTNTLNANHIRGINMAEFPWFLDTLNNNFEIEPCSPLVNAGVNLLESTEDHTGMARPFPGGVSDIGAYEYGGNPYGNNGSVIYVDGNASGNNDGTSWNDAYDDLHALFDDPPCGGRIDTVWVTSGTYLPPNDPNESFEVWDGMVIIGNFSGGEVRVSSRTRSSTPTTIISGDIGIMGDNSDNSRHVIEIPSGLTALFQDVIIEEGNANGTGDDAEGGALFNNGQLTLKNVIIRMNQGLSQVYNRDPGALLTLEDCIIIRNGLVIDLKNLMGGQVVIKGSTEIKN